MPSRLSSNEEGGSQASPSPSRSLSRWVCVPATIGGFGTVGQSSTPSSTPSASLSSSTGEHEPVLVMYHWQELINPRLLAQETAQVVPVEKPPPARQTRAKVVPAQS